MTAPGPRLLIGGTGSGCGKTTVACAVMQALVNRGQRVAAFKCGPDFIDPMFHTRVIGVPSRNLDAFLMGRETVPAALAEGSQSCDMAVIEGVMGFYDGMRGESPENSTADIGHLTETPAVLVAGCRGMGLTLAAILEGLVRFRPNTIQGVILNGISKDRLPYYREIVEKQVGIALLGCMPQMPAAAIESRHLGLVTAVEIEDLAEKLALLAAAAADCIDLDSLLAIARSAPALPARKTAVSGDFTGVTLAVARDAAFCFAYADSLGLLERMGTRLRYFSPLRDERLPDGADGLILCGGYPELYAETLSRNSAMRRSICRAVAAGLPTIAECGGFLYLQEALDGHPMAGALPGRSRMTKKLGPFGYVTLTARRDNLLCKEGETLSAHEFHYAESEDPGDGFLARRPGREDARQCVHVGETLFAGYPHIHFAGNPAAARRFLAACQNYGKQVQL